MKTNSKIPFNIIFNKFAVVSVFFALILAKYLSLVISDFELTKVVYLTLVMLVYLFVFYGIYREKNIAHYFMSIVLILSGFTTFISSIFPAQHKQYGMFFVFFITGAYFFYGGLILFREALSKRQRKENKKK